MSKRIIAIEYIRGLAMLGVIGIHTGAYSLSNPQVNIHLFALLEIVSRFTVPIFFFVSSFGLFLSQDLAAPFNYCGFMKRRLRTVLIPYLTWSALYLAHSSWITGDFQAWHPAALVEYLFFGLASYQLYFLVILLWFYALMPLWRMGTRLILQSPRFYLGLLLLLQIAFNYYSCYSLRPDFSGYYINQAIRYRLSYWVLHYFFIFLLGAVAAVRYASFATMLRNYRRHITAFFAITLTTMLIYYYYLLLSVNYTPEDAVNTVQQLSPPGVLYTLGATLFCFMRFNQPLPSWIAGTFRMLGEHSYAIYLFHPFVMYYLNNFLTAHDMSMSVPVTSLFFCTTVIASLLFGVFVRMIGRRIPAVPLLLLGATSKK